MSLPGRGCRCRRDAPSGSLLSSYRAVSPPLPAFMSRASGPPMPAPRPCSLSYARAPDPKSFGNALHREPPLGSDRGRKIDFFCLCFEQGFSKDLVLHGLPAKKALQFADPLFGLADFRSANGRLVRSHGCHPLARQAPPSIKKDRPLRWATEETVSPGLKLSLMIRSFCSVDHDPTNCYRKSARSR